MHTFRSMLANRRKNQAARKLNGCIKSCIEALEQRLFLSATTLTISPSPGTYGTNVTLTATVTPSTALGTVTFQNGVATIGTQSLNGTTDIVTLVVNNLPANTMMGGDQLLASYVPSDLNTASNSGQVGEIVNLANTTVSLMAAPTTSTYASSVTLTATITNSATSGTATAATGTVTFLDNGTSIGSTNSITNGVATFMTSAPLPRGSDSLTASYGGDSNFNPSAVSPAVTETVNKANSTTTVSPLAATTVGTTVTLTAAVSSAAATGTVTFYDNGISIGTGTLTAGVATLPISTLPAGMDSITASYGGDTNFNASPLSSPVTEDVTLDTTTTSLAVSTNNTMFGMPVTLTATVSPAAATGTVTFLNGVATVGSASLVGGVATLVTTTLPASMDSITASYPGDMVTYGSSVSTPVTVTVMAATTTTVLTTSAPPSVTLDTPVTLTATITPAAATGSVTFYDGVNAITGSPVTVSGGVAMLVASNLPIGMNQNLTADFIATGGYASSSSSPPLQESVTAAVATVAVSSSANPAPLLSNVTFTATVSAAMGLPLPTGTVTFYDNGTAIGGGPQPLTTATGLATLTISTLALGNHPITAVYSGDMNFAVSAPSAPIAEVINPAITNTALMASLPNPMLNQLVTFTAVVTPMVGGGPAFFMGDTVTFYDTIGTAAPVAISGALPIGTGTVMFSTMTLPVGTDDITAVFSGDANYATSTSPVAAEGVGVGATTTNLTTSATSIPLGNMVTLTAAVSPSTATGTVSFFENGTAITGSPVTLAAGIATLPTTLLPLGTDVITASYSGDMNYGPSTQTSTVTVTVNQAATSTTLTAMPATAAVGAPVVLTATITPGAAGDPAATGNVNFYEDGTTLIGTVAASGGVATLTTTTLALGNDSITATYVGSANYIGSASSALVVPITSVTSTTSTTTLTTSSSLIAPGDSVTLSATVAPAISGGATPTGTVTFYDGATAISTAVTLNSNGVAVFATTTLPSGTNSITATYNGANYSASTSAPVSIVVGTASSFSTTLSVSNNSVIIGTPVTLQATIDPTTLGGMVPSAGSVTFFDGTNSLGSVSLLSNGTAAITVTLPAGAHTITAAYSVGSSNSSSTPIVVTVNSATIPSIDGLVIPPDVVAGLKFHAFVPVLLANAGAKLKGAFIINLYASTNTVLDGTQVLLATMKRKLVLNSNQSRTFNVRLTSVPATLPPGTYHILVEVIDPTGASNLGRSMGTVGVLAPVITLDTTLSAVTPASLAIGGTGSVLVTVTNNGNETATGALNLVLQPSSDGASPISDVNLAVLNLHVRLAVGQTHRYRLHFSTGALAAGMYYPYLSATLAGNTTTNVGGISFTVG